MKRVPLDFDWPHHEPWRGYLAPEGLTDEEYDVWEGTDPPTGDGYQLWETVSEGSPISPVFASVEELAKWCEANATIFADIALTEKEWLELFQDVGELEVGSLMLLNPGTGYFGPACRVKDNEEDPNEN